MKKYSQKETIKNILLKKGKINNFDAIMKLHVWRLGAVICELREDGMEIEGEFLVKNGKQTKIYQYNLVK